MQQPRFDEGPPLATLLGRAYKVVGGKALVGFFEGASALARAHPRYSPARHAVRVERDIAYTTTPDGDALRLDIWRPEQPGPHPVALYVHGGGFKILSKSTHWLIAMMFARFGYVVFNIDYRLAPKHPYPAAVQDVHEAYAWVVARAHEWGGDIERGLVVGGESAGANLAMGVALSATLEREEEWAQRVFETARAPDVVYGACGLYQVTDAERYMQDEKTPSWVSERIGFIRDDYVGEGMREHIPGYHDFADPLVLLEQGPELARPFPSVFMIGGLADYIVPDTQRMHHALDALGVDVEALYYAGEPHVFQVFVWREQAMQSWRDFATFLNVRGYPGVLEPLR
ncbi:MAG: alpha/beta hydrolase [Myxococcota bacterium]